MTIPLLDEAQILHQLKQKKNPFFTDYYAFYSSWLGGIITDPHLMLLPMDDHLAHRGDGVFEGIKVIDRGIYMLDDHLDRLFYSAENIALDSTWNATTLKDILLETLRVANKNDAMVRIFLSRGPGHFTVNPYDSVGAQLYIVIHQLHIVPEKKYQNGVAIGKSKMTSKPSWLARIKSCNYLPNVLMKKEAVDRQLDFVIGIDEEDNVTESATENVMMVDKNGVIVIPKLDSILKGITMMRACELAREAGFKTEIRPIHISELTTAREIMMAGTTLNILPVTAFEKTVIGDGKPGTMAKKLNELILEDSRSGSKRTVF